MTMHTLVCRSDDKWAVIRRDHETVGWYLIDKGASGRLRETVEASLDLDPLTHNWTFSEREADVVMGNIAEEPAEIPHVDWSLDISIFAPEGRFDDASDRWATMNRASGRAWPETLGVDSVFRPQTLRQAIRDWFGLNPDHRDGERHFKTFLGGKHGIEKPCHKRELWVRGGPAWRVRLLFPNKFPALQFGPIIGTEAEAKRLAKLPQNRKAAKRAKHQENLLRFRAEAEARRAAQETGANP